ncbi:NUDIX domain-containing protein [Nocardioides sp. BP30]|uniref:NUDIX hydrolase n=1 Tax=Nocardioides sp. BP30 TaxID=3036374 RepID=UPI00246904E2|nr:NUDIX domain-containing protein [Nocardioides sp. BP30]WGL52249.1 NUDIX domain-containing protein [Nocardioides sp. BP30]
MAEPVEVAGATTIVVAAVVLRDEAGRVLNVRKRGTTRFMLPGGKPEPGETPAQTAVREVAEELGVTLDPARLVLLGEFEAAAANEPGHLVRSTVFTHPARIEPAVAAEIEEVRWASLAELESDPAVAELTSRRVVPALRTV